MPGSVQCNNLTGMYKNLTLSYTMTKIIFFLFGKIKMLHKANNLPMITQLVKI